MAYTCLLSGFPSFFSIPPLSIGHSLAQYREQVDRVIRPPDASSLR